MRITKKYINGLSYQIIGAAIEVHKHFGPGLNEKTYHLCLKKELELRKLVVKSELKVTLDYKGLMLDSELRCDLFVEYLIVVELKSVKKLLPVHEAQVITYSKLLKCPKGILINFNVTNIFHEGQKSFVNEYFRDLPDE